MNSCVNGGLLLLRWHQSECQLANCSPPMLIRCSVQVSRPLTAGCLLFHSTLPSVLSELITKSSPLLGIRLIADVSWFLVYQCFSTVLVCIPFTCIDQLNDKFNLLNGITASANVYFTTASKNHSTSVVYHVVEKEVGVVQSDRQSPGPSPVQAV